jgi:hypothetical protein
VVRGRQGGSDADLMTYRFEVHVAGRLPEAFTDAIGTRFGKVTVRNEPNATVLNGRIADQAALRSLLTMIWDTNGNVLSANLDPEDQRTHS